MPNRFEQARRLVQESKSSLATLQTDGLRGVSDAKQLTDEFSIGVLNILTYLRGALDRCACELHDRFCPKPAPPKKVIVYFPIADKGKTACGFADWVNKNQIRGLNDARPDIVKLLESYQEFSNPSQNGWLPEFKGLSNTDKHDTHDPSTAQTGTVITAGNMEAYPRPCAFMALGPGGFIINFKDTDTIGSIVIKDSTFDDGRKVESFVMVGEEVVDFRADPAVELLRARTVTAHFDATGQDAIPFLQRAVAGTDKIVEEIVSRYS
jgi:hypothetical protein